MSIRGCLQNGGNGDEMHDFFIQFTEHLQGLFIDTHYQVDRAHEGTIYITRIEDGQMKYFRRVDVSRLKDALTDLDDDHDYYLTPNSFMSYRYGRKTENLYSLHNIVIDLDQHARTLSIDELDAIATTIKEQAKYTPNSIIFTGRGLQLWYSIEQASYKLQAAYSKTREDIISDIERVIDGAPVEIDYGASRRDAGLMRVPGSVHQGTGRRGVIDLIHSDSIDIVDHVKETVIREKKTTSKGKRTVKMPPCGGVGLQGAAQREQALKDLIRLRRGHGQSEYRHLICFYVWAIWDGILDTAEAKAQHVKEVNKCFERPLDDKELSIIIKSLKSKSYKITSKKIIDTLNLTREEQKAVGLYENKREQEAQQKREAKEQVKAEVIRLHGLNYTAGEIAEATGLSRSTVVRYTETERQREA